MGAPSKACDCGKPRTQFNRPPEKFSKQQIRKWVNAEAAKTVPNLPVKLLEPEEWAHYINEHHFVPLTLEGVPEGHKFDYTWVKEENPRRGLPTAEVTESGNFLMWWDRCNYYEMTEKQCRDLIHVVVRHEGHHYNQWKRIAKDVLTTLGYNSDSQRTPTNLAELALIKGAKEAFMKIWADGAHYQCREVETYSKQIDEGDFTAAKLGEVDFKSRLQRVYVYAHGNDNSPGCANSKWAKSFSVYLDKLDKVFKTNNIKPPQPAK